MLKNNVLKEKLKRGETVLGTWSSLSSANVINVLGATDLDFVVIDMEHGSMSFETVENIRASSVEDLSKVVGEKLAMKIKESL